MPVPIRVAGALSGTVTVESLEDTVGSLRAEVARLLGCAPPAVRLIAGGATLANDAATLVSCRVTAATRLLVTRGGEAAAGLREDEAKAARLDRVRASAAALAGRAEETDDVYSLVLENQAGEAMNLSNNDRVALTQGLLLAARGKKLLQAAVVAASADECAAKAGEASSVFFLALGAFDEASPGVLKAVDNFPLTALEWCWALLLAGAWLRFIVSFALVFTFPVPNSLQATPAGWRWRPPGWPPPGLGWRARTAPTRSGSRLFPLLQATR